VNLNQMIAQLRSQQAAKLAERGTHTTALAAIAAACEARSEAERNPTDVEASQAVTARAAIVAIDAELATLAASVAEREAEQAADEAALRLQSELTATGVTPPSDRAPVTVTGEERTYTALKSSRGEAQFFVDAYRAEKKNDWKARERLDRHAREVEVEGEYTFRDQGDQQDRAITTGSFAGLVVPQYLVDQAALLARAGRPFANAVQSLPLPDQGMSLIIPRGTTGASATSQATENTAASNTDEVWANLTVPVVTISGQQDVSRQSLERGTPGIDTLVYMDLAGAYAAELDRQVIVGSGASNQMLGMLLTAGVNQAAAFTAAVTATTIWSRTSGQKAAVAKTRFLPSNLILMHPDRWGYLESLLDSAGRPLVVPNAQGPMNTYGVYAIPDYGVIPGTFHGLPVITDANVPTNIGSGPEDVLSVLRKEDQLLWEQGDGMPRELSFEQTAGSALTTKLVVYGYAAFTAGRYPKSVGLVGGNSAAGFGLIAPTF
jgi:HK97 family phage major capsid protein